MFGMPTSNAITNQQILTALKALDEPVNELKVSVTIMQGDLRRVMEMTEETRRTLRGTDGEPGLVERVRALERSEKDCQIIDLAEIVRGKKDGDPGLLERVRNLEEFQETLKKLIWLIVGAVGVDVIMRIWSLVVK
jgi:hypothetical protein